MTIQKKGMDWSYSVILAFCILFSGVGSSLAAVDLDKDVELVKAARTQFSPDINLDQVFNTYPLFRKVEWRGISGQDSRDSVVTVVATYDLDKLAGLQYGELLPQISIDQATVDVFKSEFSEVHYIINFSLLHMGAGVAVKVESTSFNMVKNNQNNFFPDSKLEGFRDIALKKPPQFILSTLIEMRDSERNPAKGNNQITSR